MPSYPGAHILSPFDMRPTIRCPLYLGRSSHTVHIIVVFLKKNASKGNLLLKELTNRRRQSL